MKKHPVLIVIATLIMIFTLAACNVVDELSTVSDTGKTFMTALEKSDYEASWNLLASNVQEEIGSKEAWVEWASIRNFPEWKFTNTEFENNTAQMDGEATLDGVTYQVTLVLDKVDDTWKVSGILFE